MKRKWIILLVLGLVAAAVIVIVSRAGAQRREAALSALQTIPVERGPLQVIVGASGRVRSHQTALLTWQTTGTVGEVAVSIGDLVSPGQELTSLQHSSLPQNLILARAELFTQQKALDNLLNSDLARSQARQEFEAAQRALDDLEEITSLQRAEAVLVLLQAQKAFDEQERIRNNLNYARASEGMINASEARYILAQNEVDQAQDRYGEVSGLPEDDPRRALALADLADKQKARDAALRQVNWYKGNPSEGDIAEADANLEQARVKLAEAQRTLGRIEDGPDPTEKALLEARLDDARRAYERLAAGPDPEEIAAAEARLAATQATLDLANLKAPISGTITGLSIQAGDQVTPGLPALQIDDLSRLLVEATVSEVDINRVGDGQPVNLTFDAIFGKEYSGQVVGVAKVGQANQGVVEFIVTVELQDADQDVRPGMTAAVNIVAEKLEEVILVPNRAVRTVNGARVVFVMRNGLPELVEVTLGKASDVLSELIDGDLRIGEPVILNPPSNLVRPGGFGGGGPFEGNDG